MKTRCKRCLHDWDYGGKSEWYATCPNCYNKHRIREQILAQTTPVGEKEMPVLPDVNSGTDENKNDNALIESTPSNFIQAKGGNENDERN